MEMCVCVQFSIEQSSIVCVVEMDDHIIALSVLRKSTQKYRK